MNIALLVLLYSAAALSLVIGLIVMLRDYKRLENIGFAGLSLGVACWAIGIANFLSTNSPTTALYWAKFYYFAPLVIGVSSVYFAQYFLYQKVLPRFINGAILLSGLVLAGFLVSQPHFITSELVYRSYGKQIILDSTQYGLYGLFLIICFCLTIVLIIKKRSEVSYVVTRQQVNIFLNGFVVSSVLGVYFNLILPAFGNYRLIMVGPMMTTFLLFSVAYAIIRHRLFDLRTVVLRAAAYGASSMILSALYIAPTVYILSIVIMGFPFVLSKFIIGTIVGTIAATYYSRVRKSFDRLTERIFFRDAYDSVELIGQLNRLLVSTTNMNKMLQNSINLILSNIKSEFCTFILKSETNSRHRVIGTPLKKMNMTDWSHFAKTLDDIHHTVIVTDLLEPKYQDLKNFLTLNDIAALICLRSEAERDAAIGYMVLGYKKSGNAYNNQDSNALEAVANSLVIAIQNALHYEEIQNFNVTLQRKVDEATGKLRRTNAKLKALDETKDDFISMASHQLRTPLTSVKGYLSMVLEGDAGKLTVLQRKMLDQAFVSSQRMVFLIADLLNVSRLKTGKFVIEPAPVDLSKMVEDEVRQLQETAKSRSLELLYARPAGFPQLMLDDTKMRQVIMNFIDNAIYYTPAGGSIRVELTDKPEAIELRVIDSGIGVPKSEQPHLFTKFYRAGNARKARPDGTGLGLFMAKKVIIAQGGVVIFESREGRGSTFGFVLPKSVLPRLPAAQAPAAAKSPVLQR